MMRSSVQAVLTLALFLAGCGQASPGDRPAREAAAQGATTRSIAARSAAATSPASQAPVVQFASTAQRTASDTAHYLTCVVAKLADGDSFTCTDGRKVRLLLIDTPELAQRPWGVMAKEQLAALARPGRTLRFELDRTPTDRYGRTLAYAWADSVMINERMIADGWAVVLAYENVRHLDRLQRAERAAQAAKKGFWRTWRFRCPPVDFRARRCGRDGASN